MSWLHPSAWTGAALKYPRATAVGIVLMTVIAAFGAVRVETAVGYRAFLGKAHPVVLEFDDFVDRFDGGLPLLAVWSCDVSAACSSALDESSLRMADAVAGRLVILDAVRRVDSPATTSILARQAIGFPKMRRLVRGGRLDKDVADLRIQALEDPSWLGRIVSADGSTGALVVHLRDSASDTAVEVYAAVREAVADYESLGFEYSFVGGPVEFVVAGADLEQNTRRVIPLMVAVIAVSLVILFGAPAAAGVSLLFVGVSIVWTLGVMGWLGWEQNSLTQILPPLVLVVGVCDAIHLLGRYSAVDGTLAPQTAIRAAALGVGAACAMTSATTIAGFASLATSGLESISRFGVLAAVAVVASLLLTFTALPLLVCRLPRSWFVVHGYGERWRIALAAVGRFATGPARRGIVVASVLAGIVTVAGVAWLRIDARFEDLYGEDSDVVRWVAEASERLRAPETLEIALRPPAGESGLPVAAFGVLDRVQRWAAQREGLGRSLSLVDVMRRLNDLVHGDSLPLGEVEDAKGRPSSIYRLLRNRDPHVTDQLLDSQRSLRVSIEAAKLPQDELREVLTDARTSIAAELPDGWSMTITGPLAVVSRMIDAIRDTQLKSFGMAVVVVFLLVMMFFRSVRLAIMAMVPTLLPVAVTLGMMGWLGIALDIGTAMVASIILGLAVDDAIHFLTQYAIERRQGATAREASRRAVLTTGRAITTTSLALAVGFVTLSLSAWSSIASFGVVAAISVLTALVAVLFVLPALTGVD